MSLRSRVQKLESGTTIDDKGRDVFIEFISPGVGEIRRISTSDGQVWLRNREETAEQFRTRATSEAPPRGMNCVRVFYCDSVSSTEKVINAYRRTTNHTA
jgi:hypothetical protein